MECGISVKARRLSLVLSLLLSLAPLTAAGAESVVLVTSVNSPIEQLDMLEIRKVYLGLNVTVGRTSIRGIRLLGDDRLNEIFLQTVVAMSERSYERRLLSLTLKYGRPRPEEVTSVERVVELLNRQPSGIAYLWRSDAQVEPTVRVLKVLWQEQ